MPETFLILLSGGVMIATAIPNPKDVTLHWLRLAGIIALTFSVLSLFFWVQRATISVNSVQAALYGMVLIAALFYLPIVQLPLPQATRPMALSVGFGSILLGAQLIVAPVPHPHFTVLILSACIGISALPGIALMDMLLGHAYLTASQMTMAPFRRLNLALLVLIIARAILAIGVTMLLNAQHPIEMLWSIYGLYILTRWLVGLLIPGIFVWMAHDCIKRRATQSATGILYVAGVLIFIGEIIALYLVRQIGLPF